MNEIKETKNNGKDEENNKEEKQTDVLKNNINNINISDINIKNQSMHNNNENEEIKLLIDNNIVPKKEEKKEDIIKKVNNIPKIESYFECKFSNTLKKITNKSIEKKMKDLFESDKKNNKNENVKDNKFIDKLNEIKIKIKEINEYNKKKKHKKEINIKNYKCENNRYNSINKEKEKNLKEEPNKKNSFYFDYNDKNLKEDDKKKMKYNDHKRTYFSYDNFYFYNIPSENKKKNRIMNYVQDLKKIFKKYDAQRLLRQNNYFDCLNKLLLKVDKFKQNQEENKFKSNNLFKNSIDFTNTIKYKNKSNLITYKSLSFEKPSKLERMIENIYKDINKAINIPSRNDFNAKLIYKKSKIGWYV